jgi:hypothetical protein
LAKANAGWFVAVEDLFDEDGRKRRELEKSTDVSAIDTIGGSKFLECCVFAGFELHPNKIK